jgi:hypothetical protein
VYFASRPVRKLFKNGSEPAPSWRGCYAQERRWGGRSNKGRAADRAGQSTGHDWIEGYRAKPINHRRAERLRAGTRRNSMVGGANVRAGLIMQKPPMPVTEARHWP